MKKKNELSPEDVVEVQHFVEVQEKYERFKAQHSAVFEELGTIAEEYNTALQAADKAVRSKKVACGPFQISNFRTTYHGEKLYEELGKEEFLRVGGVIKTETIYEIDKAKFEAHVAANAVPKEVVDIVKDVSPSYKKIHPIDIG